MATVEEAKRARQQAREAGGQSGRRQQAPEGTTVDQAIESGVEAVKSIGDFFQSGPKTVSTGILDTIGIPGSIGEASENLTGTSLPIPGPTQTALSLTGQEGPSLSDLPSGYQLRGLFNEALRETTGQEDVEGVLPPGEEPETFAGRFQQNLGSMLVPMSMTSKGVRGMGRLLSEVGSEAAGAGLGLQLEKTRTFEDNPMMGRLVGELVGGVSVPFAASGGPTRMAVRGAKKGGRAVKNIGKGDETARAAQRAQDVTISPDLSLQRLSEQERIDQEIPDLLPAFVTNDPGVQRLTVAAQRVDPEFAQEFAKKASQQSEELRKAALQSGDPEKVVDAINTRLTSIASEATESAAKFRKSGRIPQLSEQVTGKLRKAYDQARKAESRVWSKVPENPFASPQNTRSAVKKLYQERTTKAGRKKIPQIIEDEFGKLKDGRLVGGEFSNKTPKAKQLHELYSELGDELANAQKGDITPNQVRTLTNLRESILQDLNNAKGGERYQKAINVSRQLNDRFTKGEIGKVLGFRQGDAVESNVLLEKLAGKQGPDQANAVDELLKASPSTQDNIKDFLRSSFYARAKKTLDGGDEVIDPKKARDFLDKHEDALDRFPDVRAEMERASESQEQLDKLFRNSSMANLSPYNREKSAAAIFIGEDPTDAMGRIIASPAQRKQQLSQLVDIVKKDGDKEALRGLKTSFTESLFNSSRSERLNDEFTQLPFISGKRLRKNLEDLEKSAKQSGLFSEEEFSRLKQISNRLEGIENTLMERVAEGGIIEPKTPKKYLDILVRSGAARAGGEAGSGSMGGSLQQANIAVEEARKLLNRLSQDEAESLLVKAVRDKDTFKQLLENPAQTAKGAKESISSKLVRKAKEFSNRPGTLGPSATTAAKGAEEEGEVQKAKRLRNQLRQEQ